MTQDLRIQPFEGITPSLGQNVYLHPSAQVIGAVCLADNVSFWCNAVARGDVNRIEIGRDTNIQDFSMLHVSHKSEKKPEGSPLIIGERVTVGHHVILHGCRIGDECLIGMGATVMDDAVIESRVLLAAGSLVPAGKRLESGFLYMGSPVKQVRPLTPEEIAHFAYSAAHYVRLAKRHQA